MQQCPPTGIYGSLRLLQKDAIRYIFQTGHSGYLCTSLMGSLKILFFNINKNSMMSSSPNETISRVSPPISALYPSFPIFPSFSQIFCVFLIYHNIFNKSREKAYFYLLNHFSKENTLKRKGTIWGFYSYLLTIYNAYMNNTRQKQQVLTVEMLLPL